ncbi:MAG: HK97 family phage prohead protease [Acidimicrobiales bacterium]
MSTTIEPLRRRGLCRSGARELTGYAYRSPDVEVRASANDSGTVTIEGYAIVWSRYSSNLGGYVEQIDPNAFDDSLVNDDQIASYNHEYASILGRRSATNLVLTKDSTGLRYSISGAASDPDVIRVAEKVRAGSVVGSSFTFRSMPDGESWSYTAENYPLVTVARAALYEVAPVVWPAYMATTEEGMAVGLRSLAEQHGIPLDDLHTDPRELRLREFLESTSERATPAIENLRHRARWLEISA